MEPGGTAATVGGPPAPSVRGHLPALDGLRGIAILLVFLFHYLCAPAVESPVVEAISRVTSAGWIGVDLFFVLSGFLITGILADSRGRPGYFRNFYARRTLRIFPLYYATVAVVLVAGRVFGGDGFRDAFWSPQGWLWTYSVNFRFAFGGEETAFHGPFVNLVHLWTLAIEEQFYLVWPMVVLALSPRRAMQFSALLAFLAFGLRSALLATDTAALAVYVLPFCRMDSLCTGAFLALAMRHAPTAQTVLRHHRLAGIVAASLVLPALVAIGWRSWVHPFTQTAGYSLLAVASGSLLVHAVSAPADSRTAAVLGGRVLTWLGRYSYGIYVFHYLYAPVLERYAGTPRLGRFLHSPVLGLLAHGAIGLAGTTLLAWLSYRFFETPFLRFKSRFESAAPRAEPALQSTR